MTIQTKLKRPEVLAPGGTLEKLKTAIHYGADAVYIAGVEYGLRRRAGNFTFEEMQEGVQFAKKHGAKVYVAANMIAHENDTDGAGEFFRKVRDTGVDAVIVADPALIEICIMEAPGLPVHLSTQASATNYETLNFWHGEGLERVVLGREVTMDEIREMRQNTDVEIEVFIHGAMCISYSGRCTLSNHMSARDANRGGCSQSCRWRYDLFEIPELTERHSLLGGDPEEAFSMSAVDMSMIRHIPELVDIGVDSLKIEGRMKSIHYVSTVSNVYSKVVDAYCSDPENFEFDPAWEDELWKVAQRELATGFYFGTPTEDQQLFGKRRKIPGYTFIGQVLDYDEETGIATIEQRNLFEVGDEVEFYGPNFTHHTQIIEKLWDENGNEIDRAPHPLMKVKMKVTQPVKPLDMMRKRKN